MTRDFNKPRRDDTRPSSRHTPSNNYREEQPFKPGRPRLSRDAVDRAWENGGNRNHADYRTRQNTGRPPFQPQRPGPAAGRNGTSYGRPGYGERPENYRGPASNTGYQRRDQGSESDRRPFDSPNYRGSSPTSNSGYQRRDQGAGYRGPASNSHYQRRDPGAGYRGASAAPNSSYQRRDQGSSYRGPTSNSNYQRRDQGPGGNKRPFNGPGSSYRGPSSNAGYQRRNEEPAGDRRPFNETEYRRFSAPPPHSYQRPGSDARRFNEPEQRTRGGQPDFQHERWSRDQRGPDQPYRGGEGRYQDTRPPRFQQSGPRNNAYRPEDGPRGYERGEREREQFARGSRPGGPPPQRDNHNPRWQSRPAAQRGYRSTQRNDAEAERAQPGEQFEGDYERFNASQTEQFEPHVTRLPDGRVLKGSRPAQRKQARFWNDVAEETSTLMNRTPADSETTEQMEQPAAAEETQVEQPARPRKLPTAKPKAVRTVKTTLARGTGGMKSLHGSKAKALKRKTSAPEGPNTRPSKRGYKWPTPGESGE